MRTLAFTFAAVVCLAMSAQAQTTATANEQRKVSRDLLIENIYVDMTRGDVSRLAAEKQWHLIMETPESMQFHTPGAGLKAIHTIFFNEGKVQAMVVSFICQPEIDFLGGRQLGIMRSVIERGSDASRTEGTRTVMTHATNDGRTMRIVWNQIGTTQAVVEFNVVGSAGEVVPRLK